MILGDMTLPSDESSRLRDLYASMNDGELEKIAEDGSSLTEGARAALNAEMQGRDLNIGVTVEKESGEDEVELRGLVAIRKFRDLPEALLAKGSLESAGIECFLGDDNMVRMDWFISNLLGGVKLLVKTEDAEEARQLLDQPIPEDIEVEGVGDYRSPHCPKCQSLRCDVRGTP